MNADEIETRAAQLFAALGIRPDDIASLVKLGRTEGEQIEVLLPELVDPALTATLLSLVARSVLDVAVQARQAAAEAERITAKASGRRLTFKALDPDKPH